MNECDHTIGIDYFHDCLVRLSEKVEFPRATYFNFCPDCGAKLDE
jgi:hypothetical protein